MTNAEQVSDWMDGYVRAWLTNDPEDIRSLFTEDAEYSYAPWEEPLQGQDAIVADWIENKDEPEDWSFEWKPVAVDGRTAVIEARTPYLDGRTYWNVWIFTLEDDGRVSSFTEWYMQEPQEIPSVD
ncbi:MAG: hypothetical protein JWR33_2058 [Naasia sp.]|jgi:hypothetical protein|uniref:nuclear transport factor 2 family protein n=1 Tax=Naasia sp. TaxID=2546198 RepID=UPI00261D46C1|nr:nuclear transport factor 2 family protein [Naasia sp.]MCU1571317.1 hypothetical protein [Naasia sp.]